LIQRQEKCYQLIKSRGTLVDPVADFFKLSYQANDKIPYIIEGIEAKSSEKYGNHVITTKDLKTGDIIAIEEPFLSAVNPNFYHERCAYCLNHNFYNLIPCDCCCFGE
jgi:hypothetical protein